MLTVYGGVGYDTQLDALESGVDIVVGTPGRLIDLANRRALDLSHVHALVLDEADEMLDLGFLPDVERILSMTPETRQTMLFSATMPAAIVSLARTHMRHPMNIRAESSYDTQMVPATAQFIYQAHDLDKPEIIGRILQAEDADKIIVFTRTKRQAQRVADDLAERGFTASPLHGDMAQVAREKALTKFREDKIRVLVATDVAARGIDVRGVSHVINYTCPEDDKTYVHRIGRTGRAGATGHRDHLRRLGGPAPLEDDQQDARPAVRRAAGDVLHLRAPLPRPGHRARHQGPHRRPRAPVERKPPRGPWPRRPRGGGRGEGGRGDDAQRARATVRPQPRPQPHPHPQRRAGRRGAPRHGRARPRRCRHGTATGEAADRRRNRNRRRRRAPAAPTRLPPPRPDRPVAVDADAPTGRVTADPSQRRSAIRVTSDGSADPRHTRRVGRGQAVTTTVVPSGAKSQSALASARFWRMQPCELRRAELGDGLHRVRRRRSGCRGSRSRRCRPG